jgi:hypothetical protein
MNDVDDDITEQQLANYMRKANMNNVKEVNKTLRGSYDEFIPVYIP